MPDETPPTLVVLDILLEQEWWGDARGKRYGNICICITDSLCYKAETKTPL